MVEKPEVKKAPADAEHVVEKVFQKHFHNDPTFSQNMVIVNKLQAFKQDLLDRLKEV